MAADRPASRMAAIWSLVARQAAGRGAGTRVSAQDVCAAAVAAIPVSGAALIAVTWAGAVNIMWITDEISEQLADIELTVGEGPRTDASSSSGPVLAADLSHDHILSHWPAFASAAREAGAAAVFAFPLQIGAIRVGVLQLYRRRPTPLSAPAFADALLFADTATLLLLDGHDGHGHGHGHDGHGHDGHVRSENGPGGQPMGFGLRRAEIDQATGMLTEQLGTGIADAFVRLRAYAYARDRRLADVAHDIVTGRLRLGPDPVQDRGGAG